MRYAMAMVLASAGMLAETTPPACPADRPVDDIIAEINKAQSKKKTRNSNPLPETICVFGWCTERIRKPKAPPEPVPPAETRGGENASASSTSAGDTSSSTSSSSRASAKQKCDDAMEIALSAAHNVDIGDYYFEKKNYRAAFQRYSDALEEKPGDAAIHVRLGRTLERLSDIPRAIEHYQEAQKLGQPQAWSDEAKSALERLQPPGS